jgi:phospholipid/cholesterol/gamma-HCH transport system substrate-binding protein
VAKTASGLFSSLQRTQGIERAMDYIFYQVAAINGFDSFGHYLRAGLIVNQCASYATAPAGGCTANFIKSSASTASAAKASDPRDRVLQRTAAALAQALGQEMRQAKQAKKAQAATPSTTPQPARTTPSPGPAATATPTPASTSPAATPTPAPPSSSPSPSASDALLDYLFGKDG